MKKVSSTGYYLNDNTIKIIYYHYYKYYILFYDETFSSVIEKSRLNDLKRAKY